MDGSGAQYNNDVDRAVYRLESNSVSQYRDDIWEVEGSPHLRDYKPSYFVTFDKDSKKYYCDCFNSSHGEVRERLLCSRIVAVVIFRKIHRMLHGKPYESSTNLPMKIVRKKR